MCMARDAAVYVSNRILKLNKEKSPEYTNDFFKTHKLLYFAQGIMLSVYNKDLFVEDIRAHNCGPYVDGLDGFYEIVGIQEIECKLPVDLGTQLTDERKKVLNYVAFKYGNVQRDELIQMTKKDDIYTNLVSQIDESKPDRPIMSKDDIKVFFGKSHFDDIENFLKEYDNAEE